MRHVGELPWYVPRASLETSVEALSRAGEIYHIGWDPYLPIHSSALEHP